MTFRRERASLSLRNFFVTTQPVHIYNDLIIPVIYSPSLEMHIDYKLELQVTTQNTNVINKLIPKL